MADKFCFSCGAKIAEQCTFCPNCGTDQTMKVTASSQPSVTATGQNQGGGGSKVALIVIGIVIAVALIALCIILVINGGSNASDDYSIPYDITVDNNGNISANTIQNNNNSDITEPVPDTPEVVSSVAPYAKLNGESLYDCSAAYTYSDGYGSVVAISGLIEEELGVIACVATGNDSLKSGYILDENGCSSSTYFDIVLIEGSDAEEYTTANNPSMFDDCEFKLISFKEKSEATFTMLIEFSYNGEDYQFEAGATASYQEAPANSNVISGGSGTSGASGSSGSRMCALCYGKGICSVCNGSGLNSYYDFFTKEKRACDSCGGTLICKGCNGQGYY